MEFNAKLAYSDKEEPLEESDWTYLHHVTGQRRPLICSFFGEHTHEVCLIFFTIPIIYSLC